MNFSSMITIPFRIFHKKRSARHLCFAFLILSNLQFIYAQLTGTTDSTVLNWKSFFNQSYGTDYNLVNGIRYINKYPSAEGHPFLGEDRFYRGKLVINNQIYPDMELKYDLCNQEIILQYPYFTGSTDKIILIKDFIDEFELDGKLFRKYTFPETAPRFYQVVTQGDIYCLYFWQKDLLKGSTVEYFYKYSPEKKVSYLVIDHRLFPFKGRKSFVNLFPAIYHAEILLYIKSNNIRLKDPDEIKIRQLLAYCNELVK
jgi:hypothetical protein